MMRSKVMMLLVLMMTLSVFIIPHETTLLAKTVEQPGQSSGQQKGEKVTGEMVLLSGGEFWMGLHKEQLNKVCELESGEKIGNFMEDVVNSEMPRHRVYVDPLYIDKYEVTNEQFARFVKESGYKPEGSWARYFRVGMEKHPAVGVTWKDADTYAKWAGKRLPTEAEWEFAARGGMDDRLFPWGDEISSDKAIYEVKRNRSYAKIGTAEAGSTPPNSFGIYDIIGNAAEWCSDWFEKDYYSRGPEKNPTGPEGAEKKVVRGGGWMTLPFFCRVSCRGSMKPGLTNQQMGFRCARSARD
ncbi:MAG: formylglycine-generating enzyme family protein [Acidobacteriota bacterium]